MGKGKTWCRLCEKRHFPPTRKRCPIHLNKEDGGSTVQKAGKRKDSQLNPVNPGRSTSTSTPKLDLSVKRGLSLGHTDLSASDNEDGAHSGIQGKILAELQRMGNRLDRVEDQMAGATVGHSTVRDKKLSTVKKCKSHKKLKGHNDVFDTSDFSDDESDFPPLSVIRSSKALQKRIDTSIAELERDQKPQGNSNSEKIKSKRGAVEVLVNKCVTWPHEHILGGQVAKD